MRLSEKIPAVFLIALAICGCAVRAPHRYGATNTFAVYNGNCVVDGIQSATLAAAVTCAGTSGVIQIPMFAVPALTANVTIPAGVTLRFDGPSAITTTGFTLTINGPIAAPPVQIFVGTGTISFGGLSPVYAVWFPGGDIGAQINNAYSAMQSHGGVIVISAQTSSSCYSMTTPVTFTTVGKYVILRGDAVSSNNATVDTGACLMYTPTTATSAITIDWTPVTGGGYEPGAGIRDILLINASTNGGSSPCATAGGCGSSAIGVNIGPSNGGAHKALFQNFKVQGFGTGYSIADSGGIGWGIVWENSPIVWNTTGLSYSVPHEQDTYIGGAINSNGTGINLASATGQGEINIVASSFDANTTCAISMANNQQIHVFGTHWENTGLGQPAYVCGGATAASRLDITGGVAYDLVTTSTTSQNWFVAGLLQVHGLTVISNGRTSSSAVFVANTHGIVDIATSPGSSFTAGMNGVINAYTDVAFNNTNGSVTSANIPFLQINNFLDWTEGTAPAVNQFGVSSDGCYGDSTAHAIKCSLNGGPFLQMPVVVANSGTQNSFSVTSTDFTSANASGLQAITGLSWVLPATYAANYSFDCHLAYSQATFVGSDQFGIKATGLNPTNIFATANVQITVGPPSTFTQGTLATLATQTATAIVTFAPAAASIYTADIHGLIENPSGAANTIGMYVANGTAADLIVVKRGSWCRVY